MQKIVNLNCPMVQLHFRQLNVIQLPKPKIRIYIRTIGSFVKYKTSSTENSYQNKMRQDFSRYCIKNAPYSSTVPKMSLKCWKCETTLRADAEFALLVCPNCQSPQKLLGSDIPNYYELLEQPETYQVSVEDLSVKVKRLQKKLHPDLYVQKGKEEQDLSQELSSLINKAFAILSNPIERGRYLLQLNGIKDPVGEIEKEVTNDPAFLEEVMELNERLEELASEEEWLMFRKQNQQSLLQMQKEIDEAFKNKKIQNAKNILGRMKYYDTLEGKLKELKTKLGIVE